MAKLFNPVNSPPKWSIQQRKMFEALINDYATIVWNSNGKEWRQRIKKIYGVESTYDLTAYQMQKIINTLTKDIQDKDSTYQLQLTN